MTNIKFLMICLITIICNIGIAKASGLANLMKYAQRDGTMTNINKGKIVSDQRAGYITGGSIISRGPKPQNLRPIVIQPPQFSFDACSGSYDARFGGMSFISGRSFTDFLKAVPSASGAYALKMLIKEVCPQCEDIATYLETVARDINGLSLNQCNMAKSIAQGGFAMLGSSSKQRCMMQSNIMSASQDLFQASEKCNDDPNQFGDEGEQDQLKSLLGPNFNLVWKALSQGDNSAVTGLKELMMSISGSVIGRMEKGILSISILPSLIEKEDLIEKYIGRPDGETSEVTLYKCDETTKCLNPIAHNENLPKAHTLYGNISTLLESVLKKIIENSGELTDDEQALIEFSSLPLINLIELELATKNKDSVSSLVSMQEFIEVVCYDLITNFMQKMLSQARSEVEVIKSAQLDNVAIDKFTHSVEIVRGYLRDKRYEAFNKLQIITQAKERITNLYGNYELIFSRFMDIQGK